jgi:hypothetical protein
VRCEAGPAGLKEAVMEWRINEHRAASHVASVLQSPQPWELYGSVYLKAASEAGVAKASRMQQIQFPSSFSSEKKAANSVSIFFLFRPESHKFSFHPLQTRKPQIQFPSSFSSEKKAANSVSIFVLFKIESRKFNFHLRSLQSRKPQIPVSSSFSPEQKVKNSVSIFVLFRAEGQKFSFHLRSLQSTRPQIQFPLSSS